MIEANAIPMHRLERQVDRDLSAYFTRKGPRRIDFRLLPKRHFLEADLAAGLAASRGRWQRGTTRAQKTRRSPRLVASRDGPSRSTADDPPPKPLAGVRGFLAANVRMLRHLERRRAAARAA
jgi:hypothetical protein